MDKNFVIEFIVRLVLILAVTLIIPMLKNFIEVHKQEKETKTALMLADMVVRAIEQTSGLENADKKALATDRLKKFLLSKNITLSDKLIDDLIESAVNLLPPSVK